MTLVPALLFLGGCGQEEGIVKYKIPKKVPEQLVPDDDRLLAVIVPRGDKVWFFKVMGSESSVDQIDDVFRRFVAGIGFDENNEPVLDGLPKDGDVAAKSRCVLQPLTSTRPKSSWI